jgi:GNAT superfamily N-acetyltransferase
MLPKPELLAVYDAEMRRDPIPDPGSRVEFAGPVVRVVGKDSYVIFSDLDEANARPVVEAQVRYFAGSEGDVEWKVFGHDRPANLEAFLAAAGFVPDEPETLVVFDLGRSLPAGARPTGVEVRRVTDVAGLRDAASANDAAFHREGAHDLARWTERLGDPAQELFVAYADGVPVAMGRLELPPRRSFASLWGGGTSPAYRHRGIYRSLVATRAAFAKGHGYRFLTVDARETSRPILERLGFVPLTSTRGWILRRGTPSGPPSPR